MYYPKLIKKRVEYDFLSSECPHIQNKADFLNITTEMFKGEIPVPPPEFGMYRVLAESLDGTQSKIVLAVLTGSEGKFLWLREGSHFIVPYVAVSSLAGGVGWVVKILEHVNIEGFSS